MDKESTVKKILETKPEGNRRMGRHRMRWLEDVKNDMWEMKVRRW
jgi:hypothetical protein